MNKITALLLAGLLPALAALGQTGAPPAPEQREVPKIKSSDDFITLNFSNIDIAALVKVMSEYTRKNFILDEKVTGKVTLMTPTKISPDEAYQVFLSALEIKGFTAVEDGKIIRIVPTATARQSGLKVIQDDGMKGEGYVTKLIRLTYVNPQEIVRTLTPLLTKDGSLIAYPATNALIVTDSVSTIRKIETLVQAMDMPAPSGKGKINVFYLKYANAEDIAKVMQALVSRLPVPQPGAPPAGPATILEGAVTVTADKLTNSLIIVASPGDYETVKDVIQKLDIRRRQVYVEAAIIEMSLSKSRELGFEFQAANMNKLEGSNQTSVIGGTNFGSTSGNIGQATVQGPAAFANFTGLSIGAVKGTFKFNGVEFLNIGALLRALQSDSGVNILSTPNILTTDNQKAEIMVGENIPFITGQSQTPSTGGGAILTSVDRRDVGISLKITPQITSDDNVRLDVYQEISNVIQTAGLNPNQVGPSISKRSATTTVVVKDHETMVIGGLIRDNVTSSETKVPFLGDIPLLGWLFKSKTTSVDKVNLLIFITPYIIKNEDDANDITSRKGSALEKFRDENNIPKKDMGGLIESRKPAPATKQTGTAPAPSEVPAPVAPSSPVPAEKPAADQSPGAAAPPPSPVPAEKPAADQAPGGVPKPATETTVPPAEAPR